MYGDRFIPIRQASNLQSGSLDMNVENNLEDDEKKASGEAASPYSILLKNEILSSGANHGSDQRTLQFKSPTKRAITENPYALSPIGADSQILLRHTPKAPRKISKFPFKVLDSPSLKDDFYLNLGAYFMYIYIFSCPLSISKLLELRHHVF